MSWKETCVIDETIPATHRWRTIGSTGPIPPQPMLSRFVFTRWPSYANGVSYAMLFVETPIFTRQVKSLLKDEEYRALQQALMFRP